MRLLSSSYGRMASIFIGFALVFGLVGIVLQWRDAPEPDPSVAGQAVDTSQQALLVDAAWLAQRLDGADPTPVIVDLADPDTYAAEHIPGAIHIWWQDAMDPFSESYGRALRLAENPFTLPVFAPDLGVTTYDMIVVYDNAAGEHASWFVWRLRASGYPNAVVLDGGLAAWKGAAQPTTAAPAQPRDVATPEPSWNAYSWDAQASIGTEELRDRLDDPNLVVIDARTPEQARDTINDTVPLGSIPGSRSLPATAVMHPDGTFASPEELAATLEPLGLTPGNEIVVYGRFGTDTGRVWLALRLASYEQVRVYDDGWQAWATTPDLPVEPLP